MPKPVTFLTVPVELQPIAHACLADLQRSGFSAKCECSEDHFPETATILAKRGREHHFYLFDPRIKGDRVALWAGYGRSCSSETFIVFCIPMSVTVAAETVAKLREL